MGLKQDILTQAKSEVGCDTLWAWPHAQRTVGQSIDGPALPGVVGFEEDVLDDKIAVAFQDCARGQVVWGQHDILIDTNVLGFTSFLAARAFSRRLLGLLLFRFEQHAGLDDRSPGSSLKPLELVSQFLIFFL